MKEHQAREIIFEEKVKKLLQDSNYINIVEQNIPGRSSSHGINSYGKLNLPTAFIFPLRIIFQYKYYAKNKVELMHVRDFGGIVADISETNYAIQGDMGNICDRYNYTGCYFSATAFSREAQEYAWAHNIFMVSLERIGVMQPILKNYSLVSDYMTGNAILEILKAPKVPLTPDQPFERRNIMIKAFLAAAACWVLIFGGLSWLKDTIRTEEDIEQKLEARRLGTLWHERNRKKRTDIRIDDPLISFRYMESLQKLTQHVQKKMEERKAQTLLVTSVLEKEGRSTVAENLALALSMRKEKVFLLNADFRKQNASWLADEEGHLKIENFQKLLENLKKENDYVIIDTPPFLQNADTEEMAQMADASLLVVAEHRAQAKDLNAALDLLNAQGEKNLGCVYNNAHVEFLRPMASYGYQYAYHYGRYGGHYER